MVNLIFFQFSQKVTSRPWMRSSVDRGFSSIPWNALFKNWPIRKLRATFLSLSQTYPRQNRPSAGTYKSSKPRHSLVMAQQRSYVVSRDDPVDPNIDMMCELGCSAGLPECSSVIKVLGATERYACSVEPS